MNAIGHLAGVGHLEISWPETLHPCVGLCQGNENPLSRIANHLVGTSVGDVRAAALRGCPKCLLLYHSFVKFGNSESEDAAKDTASEDAVRCALGHAGTLRISRHVPGSYVKLEFPGKAREIQLVFLDGTSPPPWNHISPTRSLAQFFLRGLMAATQHTRNAIGSLQARSSLHVF